MDFFQDAPTGAVVLVVLGAFLWIVISTPLEIVAARRREAQKRLSGEIGAPLMVKEDDGVPTVLLVKAAGWLLMLAGLAWYIFA